MGRLQASRKLKGSSKAYLSPTYSFLLLADLHYFEKQLTRNNKEKFESYPPKERISQRLQAEKHSYKETRYNGIECTDATSNVSSTYNLDSITIKLSGVSFLPFRCCIDELLPLYLASEL